MKNGPSASISPAASRTAASEPIAPVRNITLDPSSARTS